MRTQIYKKYFGLQSNIIFSIAWPWSAEDQFVASLRSQGQNNFIVR